MSAFKQEERLFQAALELTDAARRQFLEEACAGDPALRAGVEALLAAHEQAAQFFAEGGSAVTQILQNAGIDPAAPGNSRKLSAEEQPGARIGHYQLLQKIGEGGCGSVYLAEQFEPVRRKVAFKIIKLGMDTRSVIARFERERQALALMDHPNIAQVFDAGATETGRPYFVMELVRGVKITDYCDQNQLGIRQRLELFVVVCHALQHAHQKGVIHRDIKPSNILVTSHGTPVPKVIDFGVAKATAEELSDQTHSTAQGNLIGTPAYMSPEQAQMSGGDMDTRSDIYSLGVLLYELLTGQTPFDPQILVQSGLDEMRRILREEEPVRPSVRLRALPAAAGQQTARDRQEEPARLPARLQGDLDWIVMKTLEKDRQRRYETANGLAMDIIRFLGNEPVLARPPSRWYQLQKMIHRNQVVFASGAAVALALITGLGAATWAFWREREARQHAEIREQVTQAAFAVSQDRLPEADRLLFGLSQVPPSLESALAYRALGEWHANNRRWSQAGDRFAALEQVNQYDNQDTLALDALRYGVVLAELGEAGNYDRFRQQAAARFTSRNSLVAERILKATLLRPAPPEFYQNLEPFAQITQIKPAAPAPGGLAEQTVAPRRAGFALVSACSFDGRGVGVGFNQPVEPASATNPANYQIPGASITGVRLAADAKTALLQLADPLRGAFTVTVRQVRAASQTETAPDSAVAGTVFNLHQLALGDALGASNSVVYLGSAASVAAGGSDLWYAGDHFLFQYLRVTNDFDYCLRVQSVSDTDGTGFARAGLMARDSLHDISGHMVTVERNAGFGSGHGTFQMTLRTHAGRPKLTESRPAASLPVAGGSNSWVRLKRAGAIFTGYTSTNEMDWVPLYEFDGALAGDQAFTNSVLYLGIATCAHSQSNVTTSVVSDFGVTPQQPVGIVSQPVSRVEWRAGAAANLRVKAAGYPLFFQWRKNGVDIPGATNGTLAFADVKPADAAIYSALVYNQISSLVTADVAAAIRSDTDPPVVSSVMSYDGLSVGVAFNKRVTAATATNLAHYALSAGVATNAWLAADGRSVILQLGGRLGGKFSVRVRDVEDFSGNRIRAESKLAGTVLELQTLSVGDAAARPFACAYAGCEDTIQAGGSDIGDEADHFVYQYLMVTNDFDFRLHVQAVQGGGGAFARAGLMARDSATNNSSHQVMVAVNAGNTFQVIARTKSNSAQTQSQPPNPLPAAFGGASWVRLQRLGTTFHAYCSDDGESWIKLYQFDSAADEDGPFAPALCLGIATSAWSSSQSVTAVVSDFGAAQTVPANTMLALALLEYRRGNYATAGDWARRCSNYPDYQAARVATVHAILALCFRQLNEPEAARFELAKAADMMAAHAALGNDSASPTQGFWYDWAVAEVLVHEAREN